MLVAIIGLVKLAVLVLVTFVVAEILCAFVDLVCHIADVALDICKVLVGLYALGFVAAAVANTLVGCMLMEGTVLSWIRVLVVVLFGH